MKANDLYDLSPQIEMYHLFGILLVLFIEFRRPSHETDEHQSKISTS